MKSEIISISFSADKVKIAHAKGPLKKREITGLIVKDIRSLTDPDITKLIKSSLIELKVKTRNVICNISSQLIITKNIEIPSRNIQEIQEIINLQSGRYTPYSREEIIVDFINIGVYRQNYTKVLLVIMPKDVANRYSVILTAAGLEIDRISVTPEGICGFFSSIHQLEQEKAPVGVVHVGDDATDFLISLKGKLIFSRNIPIGKQVFLTDQDKFKSKLIEEIKRSIDSYQSEDIERTPATLAFTGIVDGFDQIKPYFDTNMYIPSVIMPYTEQLLLKKEALTTIEEEKGISFLDVCSPLLAPDLLKIDLTPKEIRLKKALVERGKDIIMLGILSMVMFVLVCGVLMSKIYFKNIYLGSLKARYVEENKEAEGLKKSHTRIQVIKDYLVTRGYSLEVLNELNNVISSDIYLNHVKFEHGGEFSIKGSSLSMSVVFTLVSSMEQSKYFQNVKTRYTTKRKEEGQDLTDFHIICALEGAQDEEEKE